MAGRASELADKLDQDRLWSSVMELAEFGKIANGGVNRQALSKEEVAARAYLVEEARAIGLEPFTDCAGNLFLRLEGKQKELAPVLVGSHIDSQPTGGRFDGVAGVLAALEAVRIYRQQGMVPRRAIEVVAWMNEEASRFAPGLTGSGVYTGAGTIEAARELMDTDGVSLGTALDELLAQDKDIALRDIGRPCHAFLELHIEQGPVLDRAGLATAIVSGMQGTRRYRVTVEGRADHAGTTLRANRSDALMAAIRMIAGIDRAALQPDDVMLTVGRLDVSPNVPSVVPERVFFSIDLRHYDNQVVDRLDQEIRSIIAREAGPCRATLTQIVHAPSLEFPLEIRGVLRDSAQAIGIDPIELYSAAGHDARNLHYFCPAGMIFVACRDGVSHSPDEWCKPDDLATGARLLTVALWRLANDD